MCLLRSLLSVNAPITHVNCLGINSPITRTSVTQENSFQIICVIISGLIVIGREKEETTNWENPRFCSIFFGGGGGAPAKRKIFPHGDRVQGFLALFFGADPPISNNNINIFSKFLELSTKAHLLKRHNDTKKNNNNYNYNY